MKFLVQARERTKMLSDENLNASGQNSLNLVLIRYIPAKRDMRPFIKPWPVFCKALEVLRAYALGTFLALLKHWPSLRNITCLISLLVWIYLIHIVR